MKRERYPGKRSFRSWRIHMPVPDSINQRRSSDFYSDQLANGRRIRISNIVDDYSPEIVPR